MHHLTEGQLNFYKQNGFVLLDNVFSPEEIELCSKEYDRLFAEKKEQNMNLEATWAGAWSKQSNGSGPKENTSVSFL